MKLDLKNLKVKIDAADLFDRTGRFVLAKEKIVLLALFIGLLAFCGYIWYRYSLNYSWNEARKQEYMTTKNEGVVFNKTRFDKVIDETDSRRDEYQKNIENLRDIFKLK